MHQARLRKRKSISPRLDAKTIEELRKAVRYVGASYHKKNGLDYGLTPPAAPRSNKTLCDTAGIVVKKEAQRLLEDGILQGFFSPIDTNEKFPKHIWAVRTSSDGQILVFEARHNGGPSGSYHGYPLSRQDPMSVHIIKEWKKHEK